MCLKTKNGFKKVNKGEAMFIYIIECQDDSLYTGVAKDIEKRLKEHYFQEKQSAKYTKSHQMKNLKALWHSETKQNAMKLEYQIKRLSRSKKLELINNPNLLNEINPTKINACDYEYLDSKKQEIIMQKIQLEEN